MRIKNLEFLYKSNDYLVSETFNNFSTIKTQNELAHFLKTRNNYFQEYLTQLSSDETPPLSAVFEEIENYLIRVVEKDEHSRVDNKMVSFLKDLVLYQFMQITDDSNILVWKPTHQKKHFTLRKNRTGLFSRKEWDLFGLMPFPDELLKDFILRLNVISLKINLQEWMEDLIFTKETQLGVANGLVINGDKDLALQRFYSTIYSFQRSSLTQAERYQKDWVKTWPNNPLPVWNDSVFPVYFENSTPFADFLNLINPFKKNVSIESFSSFMGQEEKIIVEMKGIFANYGLPTRMTLKNLEKVSLFVGQHARLKTNSFMCDDFTLGVISGTLFLLGEDFRSSGLDWKIQTSNKREFSFGHPVLYNENMPNNWVDLFHEWIFIYSHISHLGGNGKLFYPVYRRLQELKTNKPASLASKLKSEFKYKDLQKLTEDISVWEVK